MSAQTTVTTDGGALRSVFSSEVRPDGIAVVTIDDPTSSVNTLTMEFGQGLRDTIQRLTEDSKVRGIVLTSSKKDFVVGANIEMLRSLTLAADAERLARSFAEELRHLQASTKPIVAAIRGQALGGGFELALACHAIVASDDKKTLVGLPEVQLGLMPGANGMLRVADRAGLQVALDLSLTGKNTRAVKAKKLGLIDEVCPAPILLEVAVKLAKELPTRKKKTTLTSVLLEKNPAGRAILFRKAREATRKKTRGHYPATERILDVLEIYGKKGFAAAADAEAAAFGELTVSETSHRLQELFFATTASKKDNGVDDPKITGTAPEKVMMLGGGLMGGGIAYVSIGAGLQVRLKDKDDAGVGRGLKYVRDILDERLKKKQITREERDQTFARLTGSTDYTGLSGAGVVIEAVFEDLALKHKVLRDVEAVTPDTTIFASNTSSLPIGKIAEASKRPHTVVGMHYFSPVHKMPLLEVIRTAKTAPEVVATAVALGKAQGKTVIVVNDGVGFYTSRILAPYMNEATYVLSEGVAVETIDRALVDWGFPVGPITLLDEVGIDVAAHVGPIMLEAFGDRMAPPPTMAKLVGDDRKGRKNERGFYLYGKGKKGKAVDPSVYTLLGVTPQEKPPIPVEEIQMRCALQMVNEALRCMGEGILRTPRDGDLGAIFGLGFPPFRGGPFRYVDTIGAAEILRRTQGYYDRFGKRWEPAPLLVDMAKRNSRFYGP
jgi:3-hydroxyacyl-CoA dehydrogenase/enoyl-CoA hydratase/3-hydroxybutyryl-CoA epimerase